MTSIRTIGCYIVGALMLVASACVPGGRDTSTEKSSTNEISATGRLETTAAGANLGYQISGQITVETGPGFSVVEVQAEGLKPDVASYPAHVHVAACAAGAGGHYQVDPTLPAGEANEVWPTVQSQDGFGFGSAMLSEPLRPDAKSVVIHDPATRAKIACADIRINAASGDFAPLPEAAARGLRIDGTAVLESAAGQTHVWVVVFDGLDPSATYPTHVHTGACASGAGGHYQVQENGGAGQANEIWPTLSSNPDGSAFAHATGAAAARTDARAVVIHDPATRAKLFCADLQ